MTTPQDVYENTVAATAKHFREHLKANADMARTTPDTLLKAVIAELFGEEARADGRARQWRVRMRLYDCAVGMDEPVADSDEGLRADHPGTTIIRSLSGVIEWISELASNFHGAPCAGLERRALRGKIGNLRTQMANRGDGTGVIRADYCVRRGETVQHMLLRCDVERVDPQESEADGPSLRLSPVGSTAVGP